MIAILRMETKLTLFVVSFPTRDLHTGIVYP